MFSSQLDLNATVLVVDDSEIFITPLIHYIEKKGLKIVYASSLAIARQAMSQHDFDIVLLDNFLPDGFGIELAIELQEQANQPVTMMITADDDQESISKCFEFGVHDYIVKPVNYDLLWEKIKKLLWYRQTSKQLVEKNRLLNNLLDQKSQEEELAIYVYSSMADANKDIPPGVISQSHAATSYFSGDFIFCPPNKAKRVQIFLADAMGHGLAAAICILPVISTVRAMSAKNKGIQDIFHEVNHKLNLEIPDDRFVALLGVEICLVTGKALLVNAGLPPVFANTKQGHLDTYPSRSMPLGILPSGQFTVQADELDFSELVQIALFTDGMIEQTNNNDEALTLAVFEQHARALMKSSSSWESLMDRTLAHAGAKALDDDATLCVINCADLLSGTSSFAPPVQSKPAKFEASFTLNGNAISVVDALQLATNFMQEADMPAELRQKAFTALAELVNNAIDHGILKIDSKLKNDISGFAEYIETREERLNNLTNDAELSIHLQADSSDSITIIVADSGDGFTLPSIETAETSLSGRGLSLLDALCHSVVRNSEGNCTTITISRT